MLNNKKRQRTCIYGCCGYPKSKNKVMRSREKTSWKREVFKG